MTDADWQTGTDPTPLLEYLRGKVSDRKLRLFAVAAALRFRDLLDQDDAFPDTLDHALKVAGRYADGLADRDELEATRRAVPAAPDLPAGHADDDWWAVYAAAAATDPDAFDAAARMAALLARIAEFAWVQANTMSISGLAVVCSRQELAEMIRRQQRERAVPDDWQALYANWDEVRDASPWGQDAARLRGGEVAAVLRDIAGDPFRQRAVDPRWLTPTAVALARAIYEERAFDRLPVLADALKEGGCVNSEVLNHCRAGDPHARGCWAVDLVLGHQ